jgi:hypothetical protein
MSMSAVIAVALTTDAVIPIDLPVATLADPTVVVVVKRGGGPTGSVAGVVCG